ncbi:hypothetical protein F7725_009210 [Dissostichus mawsoni]|uniref:Uncharacterized protein n=1 Tax=Dissostichus mawsoni TaxID=36200 RepID=A0A7J5Z885_DISMA|nr:hypothetical protein F7725_009210 [Dissostichus mawsoni]
MEIQSGNGEEVASAVSATSGFVSQSSPGPQVEASHDPVLREDLQAAKRIERFDIPLDNLKKMFEKPGVGNTEVTSTSSSKRVLPGRSGRPEEEQEGESVSVKERLAMYQAAVSKKESSSSSSAAVMDESEACSLPGGLASVKKQFESQEFASSSSQSSVAQFHYEQRSVQEVSSSSEVTVKSSAREVLPATSHFHSQQEVIHDERVHQNNVAASYGNHYNETVMLVGGEDLPKVSTQALKQQYEKTIEGATPAKEIKVDVDFNQFQWTPVNQSSKASTKTSYDMSSSVKTASASSASASSVASASASSVASASASSVASASAMNYEMPDHFPPPPLHLYQETPEYISSQHQESASQQKHTVSKEQYFKHKSKAELKRIYKHMNPDVRKNLEEDFLQELTEAEKKDFESEELVGEVQQACYLFENDGNDSSRGSSSDRESVE